MTALSDYAKLEAEAIFDDGTGSGAREAIISFGERSLVIVGIDDRALAHWPLASLRAQSGAGDGQMRIAPDVLAPDHILLNDPEMIRAIETVCPRLHERPIETPVRSKRRRCWIWAVLVLLVVGGWAALPILHKHAIGWINHEQETRLGQTLRPFIGALLRKDGAVLSVCAAPDGVAALTVLADLIEANAAHRPGAKLIILDHPETSALGLPGGDILLFRGLLDRASSPEAIAGIVAHQVAHHHAHSPLGHSVDALGWIETIKIILGGVSDPETVADATQTFLSNSYDISTDGSAGLAGSDILEALRLPQEPMLDLLKSLPSKSREILARHPDMLRQATLAAQNDPMATGAFTPALDDRSWLALQNICDETRPF